MYCISNISPPAHVSCIKKNVKTIAWQLPVFDLICALQDELHRSSLFQQLLGKRSCPLCRMQLILSSSSSIILVSPVDMATQCFKGKKIFKFVCLFTSSTYTGNICLVTKQQTTSFCILSVVRLSMQNVYRSTLPSVEVECELKLTVGLSQMHALYTHLPSLTQVNKNP